MLPRMSDNTAMWAERVEEWRRSGKKAPAFVDGRSYSATALRYWAKRLETSAAVTRVALARVVRPGTSVETTSDDGVEVIVGSARLVVRRGFDPVLLRELVAALGGAR